MGGLKNRIYLVVLIVFIAISSYFGFNYAKRKYSQIEELKQNIVLKDLEINKLTDSLGVLKNDLKTKTFAAKKRNKQLNKTYRNAEENINNTNFSNSDILLYIAKHENR